MAIFAFSDWWILQSKMKQLLWVVCALALLAGVRAEDEVEVHFILIRVSQLSKRTFTNMRLLLTRSVSSWLIRIFTQGENWN